MKKIAYRIVFLSLGVLLLGEQQGTAHTEGLLFAGHPPKTVGGLVTNNSWLATHGQRPVLSLSSYVEYAPSPYFSGGVGAITGFFEGQYHFSNVVGALKTQLPIENWTVAPTLMAEFPVGQSEITSQHTELIGSIFIETKPPDWHLYGYPGVRFALDAGDDHHSHSHHSHTHHSGDLPSGSVFSPHTDQEAYLAAGATYWPLEEWGLDSRVTGYYENFQTLAPRLQAGVVFQKTVGDEHTIKAGLDYTYTTSGVRQGTEVTFSIYYAP
jgi:hypothetical protein